MWNLDDGISAPWPTDAHPKSLMRMLGPKGNPQARNVFDVIGHLQRAEGVRFQVSLKKTTKGGPISHRVDANVLVLAGLDLYGHAATSEHVRLPACAHAEEP